jgi:hypothetical protein
MVKAWLAALIFSFGTVSVAGATSITSKAEALAEGVCSFKDGADTSIVLTKYVYDAQPDLGYAPLVVVLAVEVIRPGNGEKQRVWQYVTTDTKGMITGGSWSATLVYDQDNGGAWIFFLGSFSIHMLLDAYRLDRLMPIARTASPEALFTNIDEYKDEQPHRAARLTAEFEACPLDLIRGAARNNEIQLVLSHAAKGCQSYGLDFNPKNLLFSNTPKEWDHVIQ